MQNNMFLERTQCDQLKYHPKYEYLNDAGYI